MRLELTRRLATYTLAAKVIDEPVRERGYGLRHNYQPDLLEIGYRLVTDGKDPLSGPWAMVYVELSGQIMRNGRLTGIRTSDRWYESERIPSDILALVDQFRPSLPNNTEVQ